jgi:hypothetical protein
VCHACLKLDAALPCCSGGYFFGTVPDGKRVKAHLVKASGQVSQGHLMLKQEWKVRLQHGSIHSTSTAGCMGFAHACCLLGC